MKLLASDFDGTFYISEEGIKENVVEANNFIKNNLFVIATGRTYYDIKKEIDKNNIKYSYLIINHGASVIKDEEVILNISIDNNIKNKLIKNLRICKSKRLICASEKESRVDINNNDITKIYIVYKNKIISKIITFILYLKYNKFINIISYRDTIEIVAKNVDKKNAIDFIIEKEKIDKEKVYTIGDNINDINMIKEFNGFSMECANNKVKKLGKQAYKTVKELMIEINKN